ncbi:hypothetical protein GCM10010145_67600 [Streptomyces ruber]|uniref:K(+)-transporting ATPase subunit F n=2 Tax=Streptomyces TaxID=1883 RepID=A0A918F069_9ACTN|nr:hypothetical protein GCM10010145_67600 [Streptomyces ruber]
MGAVKAAGAAVWDSSTTLESCRASGFALGDRIRSFTGSPNLPGAEDGRPGLPRHHARALRAGGSRRQGGDEAVTAENIVGLVVAVALLGYLVLALIYPERF